MSSKNTGNYRVCRQQFGQGGTRAVLSEHKNEAECVNSLNNTAKENNWEYYCEREVIYSGTQFDENGNPINSIPTWIRM